MSPGTMRMPQLAARPPSLADTADRYGPDTIPVDREIRSERHFALDEAQRTVRAVARARAAQRPRPPHSAFQRRLDAVNAGVWIWTSVAVATVLVITALLGLAR